MPDFDAALARQHERFRVAAAGGMPRLGWKICVNEKKSQQRMGLASPFVGVLNGSRALESGVTVEIPRDASMAVEPELAIRVGRDVGGDATAGTARAAIAALAPALELVDYAAAPLTYDGVIESSSFHFGAVIAAARGPEAAPRIGPDGPLLRCNGVVASPPDPALVPADLADVVVLVAAFLARYGLGLRAGDWILSGACTAPLRVKVGDRVEADFGPLGTVTASFADANLLA